MQYSNKLQEIVKAACTHNNFELISINGIDINYKSISKWNFGIRTTVKNAKGETHGFGIGLVTVYGFIITEGKPARKGMRSITAFEANWRLKEYDEMPFEELEEDLKFAVEKVDFFGIHSTMTFGQKLRIISEFESLTNELKERKTKVSELRDENYALRKELNELKGIEENNDLPFGENNDLPFDNPF